MRQDLNTTTNCFISLSFLLADIFILMETQQGMSSQINKFVKWTRCHYVDRKHDFYLQLQFSPLWMCCRGQNWTEDWWWIMVKLMIIIYLGFLKDCLHSLTFDLLAGLWISGFMSVFQFCCMCWRSREMQLLTKFSHHCTDLQVAVMQQSKAEKKKTAGWKTWM